MKASERVSVIVPCYNHEKYIVECLHSVLAQTYQNKELIVIDDGSNDQSPQLIQALAEKNHFQFRLNANQGLCRTINEALDDCTGDLIVIFGSDDVMPPYRLAEQVRLFKSDPELMVAAGAMSVMNGESVVKEYRRPLALGRVSFVKLLFRNLIYAPTAMIRRSALDQAGRYDERFALEDIAMWLKMTNQKMKLVNFDRDWARYRVIAEDSAQKAEYYHVHLLKVLTAFESQGVMVRLAIQFTKFKFLFKMIFKNKKIFLRYEQLYQSELSVLFKAPLKVIKMGLALRSKNEA